MIISYKNNGGERLDKFLAGRFLKYSRSYLQKLIENNSVSVNGDAVKSNQILKVGDRIEIKFDKQSKKIDLKPANIKLDILFENNDIIILNKPAGLVVHPAAGNYDNTLVNALLNHFPSIISARHDESDISKIRPGIVHRLDKDTSGVLIAAKNQRALRLISKQIKNRNVKKIYLALCFGWPRSEKGRITSYLGRHHKNRKVISDIGIEKGKEAVSNYRLIKKWEISGFKISLIEFNIKTGRTHQIRYQAKSIGIPLLGDFIYGTKDSILFSKKMKIRRQLLHAKEISFYLPGDNKLSHFSAPTPADFNLAYKTSQV